MKKKFQLSSIAIVSIFLFIGCNQNKNIEVTSKTEEQPQTVQSTQPNKDTPKKGDHVTSNLVCMVNDAYMGKEQIEVPLDGKMYYGCCEMCEKRIPEDESVRFAIDPQSKKKVDKATAYIVLTGDNGEVAYFENEQNYIAFKNNK